MVSVEDDIIAAGAQIIWVLEAAPNGTPGTAQTCVDFLSNYGSDQGWCVGDAQTQDAQGNNIAGTFDTSPFSVGRGFDIVVPRATMEVVYTTNHGTPSGNENPTGAEVLAEVEAIVAGLP